MNSCTITLGPGDYKGAAALLSKFGLTLDIERTDKGVDITIAKPVLPGVFMSRTITLGRKQTHPIIVMDAICNLLFGE